MTDIPTDTASAYKLTDGCTGKVRGRSLYCHIFNFCDVNRFWERKGEGGKKISSKNMRQKWGFLTIIYWRHSNQNHDNIGFVQVWELTQRQGLRGKERMERKREKWSLIHFLLCSFEHEQCFYQLCIFSNLSWSKSTWQRKLYSLFSPLFS